MRKLATLLIDQAEQLKEASARVKRDACAIAAGGGTSIFRVSILDGTYRLPNGSLPSPADAESEEEMILTATWNEVSRTEDTVDVDGVEIKRITTVTLESDNDFAGSPGGRALRMKLVFNN